MPNLSSNLSLFVNVPCTEYINSPYSPNRTRRYHTWPSPPRSSSREAPRSSSSAGARAPPAPAPGPPRSGGAPSPLGALHRRRPPSASAAAAARRRRGRRSARGQGPRSPSLSKAWADEPGFRRWKDKEAEILSDIGPIIALTKNILHSNSRYRDGEHLSAEDRKAVVEKLLAYHPHSEDKIGCGLNSVMVDRHPQFRYSRCLFVVRNDGGWIDFSYQKCLRAYIREKYPSHAERFIREHFKRN
uniref:Protein DCL, chloroplastic n=1 Tax=Ananas comosus var. bracteatus TaxID=296719 RepID=A0A6V7QBB3_ANACO|nr:unnamed protein product [Ananas comosus var. bracteatus]